MARNPVSRRIFFKTMAYAGGTLVLGGLGAQFIFRDHKTVDALEADIAGRIKGTVVKDKILLEEYYTDFGNTIRKQPRLIVMPQSDDDVIDTLKLAADYGVPVNIRGAGHTCHGQSLSDGGILIINNSNGTVRFDDDEVTVHTANRWLAVEAALNQRHLTSPVLTDYLDLTVGGTLSVGGYGLRSFQYGAQVDNILSLELVTASGQTITCSPDENSTLFKYALCGLGQLGYIQRIRFQAIAYKPVTAVFYIMRRSVAEFIAALKIIFNSEVQSLIDHFSAYWVNGVFFLELGKSFDQESEAEIEAAGRAIAAHISYYKQSTVKMYHLYLHDVRKQWVDQYGPSHHLWEDYIFDLEGLDQFLQQVVTEDKIHRQLDILPALYVMACRCSSPTPIAFAPTYGCRQQMAYSVGFYYMVTLGDTRGLERAKKQLATNMDRCLELDGRPYLYGWCALTGAQKKFFYQKELEQLKQLKQQYDPMNLCNPGVLL